MTACCLSANLLITEETRLLVLSTLVFALDDKNIDLLLPQVGICLHVVLLSYFEEVARNPGSIFMLVGVGQLRGSSHCLVSLQQWHWWAVLGRR